MKTSRIFIALALMLPLGLFLFVQTGCKKDKDDPEDEYLSAMWAVGYADKSGDIQILYSTDGYTWIRQGLNNENLKGVNLNNVLAIDRNTAWAVGEENVVIKTTDAGKNWELVTVPTPRNNVELVSISMKNNNMWISGSQGLIYHSVNAGDTWDVSGMGQLSDNYLQGIHAVTNDVVYTVGQTPGREARGVIYRTVDAGNTWDSIALADDFNKNGWIGVTSSDDDNIVVYGGTSHYSYTTDGGQNWTNDSVPNTGGGGTGGADINGLTMVDNQTWWGAFDLDAIFITKDGGENWISQGPAPNPGNMWLLGIDYFGTDFAVIVGSSENSLSGKIITTNNGGDTWELTYLADGFMNKVAIVK